jgi:excisionase family DNA binding protein
MSISFDDDFLTVKEVAEHLKLNQQTVRNWIDDRQLPAVRVGRRVRVRRADLDEMLARGATVPNPAAPPPAATGDVIAELGLALERANQLLGRRSATRRDELAQGLQELSDALAVALRALSEDALPRGAAPPSAESTPPEESG